MAQHHHFEEVSKSADVICSMLKYRGHGDDAIEPLSLLQGVELAAAGTNNTMIFSVYLPVIVTRVIYVVGMKPKLVDIKKHMSENEDPEDIQYIIVVKEKLNPVDQKKLSAEFPANCQLFELKDLQFDIATHHLVPKHELITDESTIKSIVDKYALKSRNQLPHILRTDAMAKYLNAKTGNLVKVYRISPTCGENIVYRVVV